MMQDISKDICDVLESGLGEKLENFEIQKHEGNEKGQGNLGEMFFVSLKNKRTGKNYHLVVKQVLAVTAEDSIDFMSSSYINEIKFYTKVIPAFIDFQKSYPGVETFGNVPKCYATISERGKEKLLLENIKFKGYEMHPKAVPLNANMYDAIFKLYGEFHGISFALKARDNEKFLELGNSFENNFLKFTKGLMSKGIEFICLKVKQILIDANEEKIAQKFQKYVDNGVQLFIDAITYESPYAVISHGDCWSNNIMFKFNKLREVEDIQLLDFQMVKLASPIIDLSYAFYSGATGENLDKLEYFLEIYYKSLRDTLKLYDCNVDKIYPYEDLKAEWRTYCSFGFIMGLLLWTSKLADQNDVPDLGKIMDDKNNSLEMPNKFMKTNEEEFKHCSLNLLKHMYKNDFFVK